MAKNKHLYFSVGVLALIVIAGILVFVFAPKGNDPANILKVKDTDRTLGTEYAPLTLIIYSDFECEECATYAPGLKALESEFGKDLRIVYRHFPLSRHELASGAALSAEAAGEQDLFWEMHDVLFTRQAEWVSKPDQTLLYFGAYLGNLGGDVAKFLEDIRSSRLMRKVEDDKRGGIVLEIGTLPAFFLNGKKIENPKDLNEFISILETELEPILLSE